ncbi:PREDICTED: heat shock factor protein 5-like [Chaetura pelagica]|uniref:heat shock factor protein 5-like n=1 Tax=Chaetura pelagica TaxID=8897 RepID=UPI00052381FE|nr:PREDICTED: heat shock factor protein 5-like [Chaetura pelagica]
MQNPQESILSPVLLNVFISDLDEGTECIPCEFADHTKLGGLADALEGRVAIQRGLLAAGQAHPNHLLPCSYASSSPQSKSPVRAPTSQAASPSLPGCQAPVASAGRGAAFPVLGSFATEVTYTLRTVPSILPLEQWPRSAATSPPSGSSCAPAEQGWPACNPPAAAPCGSPAACTDPLTSCAGPAASPSAQSSLVQVGEASCNQSPPAQSPGAAELPPSDWPMNTPDVNNQTEVDLAAVFQLVEEICSPLLGELVQVESLVSQCLPLSPTEVKPCWHLWLSELQAHGRAPCSLLQPPEDLCAAHAEGSAERAAAEPLEDANVLCAAATEERPEPVDACAGERESAETAPCRKRRRGSDDGQSPDFHVQLDVPCKRGCFGKEERAE